MSLPIRVLTLVQPWAWAFAHAVPPKLVENRDWTPPKGLAGNSYLAIHAGKKLDREACELLAKIGFRPPTDEMVHGAIICVGFLDRVIEHGDGDPMNEDDWRSPPDSPGGRFGWVLRDVVSFEPVECRGRQKLWTMPRDVRDLVRDRYVEARKKAFGSTQPDLDSAPKTCGHPDRSESGCPHPVASDGLCRFHGPGPDPEPGSYDRSCSEAWDLLCDWCKAAEHAHDPCPAPQCSCFCHGKWLSP